MGRADYRGGVAPIRTAEELSTLLPIPLYLIVSGLAKPVYPQTSRAHPSPAVGVIAVETLPKSLKPTMSGVLPIWIHWTQWQDVVVPVMADPSVTDWAGVLKDLGDVLKLLQDVYSPNRTVAYKKGSAVGNAAFSTRTPGGLYRYDTQALLTQYQSLIRLQATSQGY